MELRLGGVRSGAPVVRESVRQSGSCSPRKLSRSFDSVCLRPRTAPAPRLRLALLASWRFKSRRFSPSPLGRRGRGMRARDRRRTSIVRNVVSLSCSFSPRRLSRSFDSVCLPASSHCTPPSLGDLGVLAVQIAPFFPFSTWEKGPGDEGPRPPPHIDCPECCLAVLLVFPSEAVSEFRFCLSVCLLPRTAPRLLLASWRLGGSTRSASWSSKRQAGWRPAGRFRWSGCPRQPPPSPARPPAAAAGARQAADR